MRRTPRAQQLRARREELRAELKRRREAGQHRLQEKLRERRAAAGGGATRRRRWWLLLLLLLLLLLALLRTCSCSQVAPEPELPERVVGSVSAPAEAAVVEPAPLVQRGRITRQDRPEFQSALPEPLPWLAAFRMQVSARSPRLAECFVGAARPGALKWTALVEPAAGRVSEQSLEPTLLSDALTRQQRLCVQGVLAEPPYALETAGERSTPSRVGLVIEF